MRTAIPAPSHFAQSLYRRAALPLLAPVVAVSLFMAIPLRATGQAAPPKASATHNNARKAVRAHRQATAAAAPAAAPQPAPQAPVAPKPPDWPANAHPVDASVVWNSQGLSIQAANSSLSQILKEVATATGAKVEGLGVDQRIFGSYGPGTAHDVLAKLLDGSGYNVLMIGDQGQGTPREIVLSAKPKGAALPAFNNPSQANDDSASASADEPPPDQPEQYPQQPQQPPNLRNGFAPGAPPRTPQQIMQEMQQRQQQLQQQPNNPQ